ncbi:unnamed protein product [Allacma fusca]|uniref:Cytochrome P450 n=1 Tax=Allacma fusca TaxID=39272 RepID=A0A8J2JY61_9HEXA|nr:unnamed protein product [Allacma fusca]
MITELLIFGLALIISARFLRRKSKHFPPGPWGFPVIGHLPLLGQSPHKTLLKWTRTYGPVIGVQFGSYRTVVINDAKLIKEALNNNAFSGRPPLKPLLARSDGVAKGILFTEGHIWHDQRRFTLKNLRDFGFGKNSMEAKIQDEIIELMDRFKDSVGKPLQIRNAFNAAVLNALWSIMLGERMKQDDPELADAVRRLTSTIDENNFNASLSTFMPWLADIAPKLSGFESQMKEVVPLLAFISGQIEKHNLTRVDGQPRDYIDMYAEEEQKQLALLCRGHERLPTLSDRPFMKYTEAVLNEVMRFSSMFPLSLFHSATEDVEFHGYHIPKDTIIMPNLYCAHFGERVWGDPQNFRPERFLDVNGNIKKFDSFIPFSTGKRVCLGESLARDELFLFSTHLFQKFNVMPNNTLPNLEPSVGVVLIPRPFEVLLKLR